MARAKSILSNERWCQVCGNPYTLHCHHIFYGPNRKNSDEWGCWVYLCERHHTQAPDGVHFNRKLDVKFKKMAQQAFEEKYGHDKFMEVFGKNWL